MNQTRDFQTNHQIAPTCLHIEGHGDRNVEHEELSLLSQLSIQVDELAKNAQKCCPTLKVGSNGATRKSARTTANTQVSINTREHADSITQTLRALNVLRGGTVMTI